MLNVAGAKCLLLVVQFYKCIDQFSHLCIQESNLSEWTFVMKQKFEGVLFVLLRYQGYIGAALVLGGMDCNGPHLYSIYPHGSTDKLPYVTMGQY